MSPRARRGAAITTGAASIAAFVALLIPQVADALNLTTLGRVLVALGVGFVTACGHRFLSCWRSRQDIMAAVRVWPPECLGGARLDTLGVYPTEIVDGQVPKYQDRPNG